MTQSSQKQPKKIGITQISEEYRAGFLFGHAIWFPWSVLIDWAE